MFFFLSETQTAEHFFNSTLIDALDTLKIQSVSFEDAGLYECVADNGIPPSIKTNFSLTIRGMKYC